MPLTIMEAPLSIRSCMVIGFFVTGCVTASRQFNPRIAQQTAGSPQAFGPGIEYASSSSIAFVLTRRASIAVVRVWTDDTPQLVYPVAGLSWQVEPNGRRIRTPLEFDAGSHRLELALPLDVVASHVHPATVPDHYLLLIAAEAPIDTGMLRRRLDATASPSDTGSSYVRELATQLMADADQPWSAYVVNPCHQPGITERCALFARGVSTP